MLLAVVIVATLTATASAQDLAALLVGRWNGQVEGESRTYPRTLVIRAVEGKEGSAILDAEYGGPGESRAGDALRPVKITVERLNGEIVLRFATADSFPVVLTLYRDTHLIGTVRGRASAGKSRSGSDFPLRLEKTPAD